MSDPSMMPPGTSSARSLPNWRPVLRRARDVAIYAQDMFAGFDRAFAAAPHRMDVSLAGETIEIASDLPEQLTIARRALADQGASGNPAARLLIAGGVHDLPGLAPTPVWEDHAYQDRRLCNKFEPTDLRLYHFFERGFWQFFDRATARGVQRMATARSVPDWDTGSPLRNLLRWHLTRPDQGFVHAGTLGVDGQGVMFAGPGGSGKSGTVLAGLLDGMQSVGDDYILARLAQSGGVTAMPVFATLKNDPEGLRRLGVLHEDHTALEQQDTGLGQVNWQGKHQFTFQDLVARAPDPGLNIHALCVPFVTGEDRTTFAPMPRQAAYLALAQTGFKQMPGDQRHGLTFCSELIRRLPTYRLSLGTDPGEITSAVRRFLAQRVDACAEVLT